MSQTVEAIYANGALRPVQELIGIPENAKVTVTVSEPSNVQHGSLAGWNGGLSDQDAQAMRQAIEEACEKVNANDWDDCGFGH